MRAGFVNARAGSKSVVRKATSVQMRARACVPVGVVDDESEQRVLHRPRVLLGDGTAQRLVVRVLVMPADGPVLRRRVVAQHLPERASKREAMRERDRPDRDAPVDRWLSSVPR